MIRAAAVLAVCLAGCALSERVPIDDPDQVSSRDLSIMLRVDGGSDGTAIAVELGSPVGRLHLAETDRVAFGGVDLSRGERDGGPAYLASTGTIEGILELVIDRVHDDDLRRSIEVPPVPVIDAPSAEISREGPISVAWSERTGPWTTQLRVTGACIEELVRELSFDAGSYVISKGDLRGTTERCPLTFAIERRVVSREGIYAVVEQIGSRTVESRP